MTTFRSELTLAPDDIEPHRAHVLECDEEIVGFYTLLSLEGKEVELEHLFVDPECLRQGHGRTLFAHACECARGGGFTRVVSQSDPNAAGFYTVLGAKLLRQIPSSIEGRTIPYFEFLLRV